MTAGWVAGTVRAKAMARRVLGPDVARQLAASRSLADAQRLLQPTPFAAAAGPALTLAAAQQAVAATILWDLRVLAGWLPRDGVSLLRLLAGWYEIANVDELLQTMAGRVAAAEFQLGALATAWPRLAATRSVAELRPVLAASAWGDPGGDSSREIRLGMRLSWAARVGASVDRARIWATEAAALLRSAEPATAGASLAAGAGAPAAPTRLATAARPRPYPRGQPVAGRPAAAWQAEADWWRRVETDGQVLLHGSESGSGPVLGAVVVMAADARRVQAALGAAARGGAAAEAYDALV